MTHDQEENQSIERNPVMTEIIKLAGKDIKTAVKNVLHMFKNIQKNMNMLKRGGICKKGT